MKYSILVPYDFSDEANNALKHASKLAEEKNSVITLLHVTPFDTMETFSTQGVNYNDTNKKALIADFNKQMLKKMQSKVKELNLVKQDMRYKVEVANFEETIESEIANEDVDLIVMGSEGFNARKELFVSSKTEKVAEKAKCPVLVVKADTPTRTLKHLIYASEFEEEHEENVNYLNKFIDSKPIQVDLIKVAEDENEQAKAEKKMMRTADMIQQNRDFQDIHLIHSSDVADALEIYAEKVSADMLAVNVDKLTSPLRFIENQTIEPIVNKANRPVMLLNLN